MSWGRLSRGQAAEVGLQLIHQLQMAPRSQNALLAIHAATCLPLPEVRAKVVNGLHLLPPCMSLQALVQEPCNADAPLLSGPAIHYYVDWGRVTNLFPEVPHNLPEQCVED